jgi:hypothetical protein
MIKKYPKWGKHYASYKKRSRKLKEKKHVNDSSVIDLEYDDPNIGGCVVRPRGQKATKQDLKGAASSLALHETLKVLIDVKEETAKRGEMRRREKEEQMVSFLKLHKKTLKY